MKNNHEKYQKEIDNLSGLFIRFYEKIIRFIKEQYSLLLTRIRFSIILQLNINYFFVVIKLLLLLNVGIVLIYSYFTFNRINNDVDVAWNSVSKIVHQADDKYIDLLQSIKHINNYEIIIFDKNKKISYGSTGKYINDLSKNSIKIFNKGYFKFQKVNSNNKNTVSNLNIKYIYQKPIQYNGETIYIQLAYNLNNEFRILAKLIIAVMCAEAICLLFSLAKIKKKNRKTLKPLDDMTNTVKNITIKEIDTRLNVLGSQNELKDLARTFNGMLDRIQKAYTIQNQFVSDASHELRTPIAVIQGYANLLDRWGKEDKDALDESIDAIRSEASYMKDLVEKLLFLARGDKDTQQVTMEEFYLNEIIDELIKETKLIDNKHIIECDRNENIKIYADAKLIKQALRIFLDNSIKYTQADGLISLSSYINENGVEIVIKDTGIGIDKDDIPKIFDRFYRADESRTRDTGGNGLGLSIAKWIIMKHKGSITVESAINVGTKIQVKLPLDCK